MSYDVIYRPVNLCLRHGLHAGGACSGHPWLLGPSLSGWWWARPLQRWSFRRNHPSLRRPATLQGAQDRKASKPRKVTRSISCMDITQHCERSCISLWHANPQTKQSMKRAGFPDMPRVVGTAQAVGATCSMPKAIHAQSCVLQLLFFPTLGGDAAWLCVAGVALCGVDS